MPISNQMSEKAYKKLQNLAITGANRFTFNEPFYAPLAIDPQQVWLDQNLIPNISPGGTNGQVIGVVKRFIDLTLTAVPGTTNSFYHASLKDCIPHTYGNGTSYNISLKDNNNNTISLGQNDWEVDRESGVLTFFGTIISGAPSGDNQPPANMPPKISFYKYVGAKGNSLLTLVETYGVADDYVFNATLQKYSNNIVYVINTFTTNTGASTININDLGAKSIMKNEGGELVELDSEDLQAGVSYILVYDSNLDVFQIVSGSGGNNSGSVIIVDIEESDWSTSGDENIYIIPNYAVLGFKNIGSVQLYAQLSGNNFELTAPDIIINDVTRTIKIITLYNVKSKLRIVGNGKVISSGTNGVASLYLDDLADVEITNPLNNQTLIYDSDLEIWVNSSINAIEAFYVNDTNPSTGDGSILNPFKNLDDCVNHIITNGLSNPNAPIIVSGTHTTDLNIHTGNPYYMNAGASITYTGTDYLFNDSASAYDVVIKGYGIFVATNGGLICVNTAYIDLEMYTMTSAYDAIYINVNDTSRRHSLRGYTITSNQGHCLNFTDSSSTRMDCYVQRMIGLGTTAPTVYLGYARDIIFENCFIHCPNGLVTMEINVSSSFNGFKMTNCNIQNNALSSGNDGICIKFTGTSSPSNTTFTFINVVFTDNNFNTSYTFSEDRYSLYSDYDQNIRILNCISGSEFGGDGIFNIIGDNGELGLIFDERTIDITGLDTLDLQYYPNVNTFELVSSNSTETISSIINAPIHHSFKLIPKDGLVLTLESVPSSSATSSDIILTSSSISLNSDSGEWIELHNKKFGTGNRQVNLFLIDNTNSIISSLIVTSTENTISMTSGAVQVAGGVYVDKDLMIKGKYKLWGSSPLTVMEIPYAGSVVRFASDFQEIEYTSNTIGITHYGNISYKTTTQSGAGITFSKNSTLWGGSDASIITVTGEFASSDSGTFKAIDVIPIINQTDTPTDYSTGIEINPTLTSVCSPFYGLRVKHGTSGNGSGLIWGIYVDSATSYLNSVNIGPNYFSGGGSFALRLGNDAVVQGNDTTALGTYQRRTSTGTDINESWFIDGTAMGGWKLTGGRWEPNMANGYLFKENNTEVFRVISNSFEITSPLKLSNGLYIWDSNGTPQFRLALDITSANTLRIGGSSGISDTTYTPNIFSLSATNPIIRATSSTAPINLQTVGGAVANNGVVISKSTVITTTSTDSSMLRIQGTFSPSSGSAKFYAINIAPTINQTSTASGDIIAINYSPTSTSILGNHYFINAESGITKLGESLRIGSNDYTSFAPGTNGSLNITTTHASGSISIQPSGILYLATSYGTNIQIGRTGVPIGINTSTLTLISSATTPLQMLGSVASGTVQMNIINTANVNINNKSGIALSTRNDANESKTSGHISANLSTVTAGVEQSIMDFSVMTNGSLSTRLRLGPSSVQVTTPTFAIQDSVGTVRNLFYSSTSNDISFGVSWTTIRYVANTNWYNNVYASSSGTSAVNIIYGTPTFNQTETASGTLRFIYYNPTVTSILGNHYAFESTNGDMLVGGSGRYLINDNGTARVALDRSALQTLRIGGNSDFTSVRFGTTLTLSSIASGNPTFTSSTGLIYVTSTGTHSFRYTTNMTGSNTNFVGVAIENMNYATTSNGTGSFKALSLNPIINQTLTSNQPSTMIDINPNLAVGNIGDLYGLRVQIPSGTNRWSITTSTAPSLFEGDIIKGSTTYTYFGMPDTDGSYRVGLDGNDLITQRKESGVWVTKHTVSA